MSGCGADDPEGLKTLSYAEDKLLFYPGRYVSEELKNRVLNFNFQPRDVSPDLIIWILSEQIGRYFHAYLEMSEEVVGEELTKEIARKLGAKHGGTGYATLLKTKGLGNQGSPQAMAEYQDMTHFIRGPEHATALFARFNDKQCVLDRTACVFHNNIKPNLVKYLKEFEDAASEAYKKVDVNLLSVERIRCRWQGEKSCRHILTWK